MSSLKELQGIGGVVSDQPIPKEIKFTLDDGVEYNASIHIVKLGVGDAEDVFGVEVEGRSRTAHLIHKCVRLGDKGQEVIPFQTAYKFHPELGNAMVAKVVEVNTRQKGKG